MRYPSVVPINLRHELIQTFCYLTELNKRSSKNVYEATAAGTIGSASGPVFGRWHLVGSQYSMWVLSSYERFFPVLPQPNRFGKLWPGLGMPDGFKGITDGTTSSNPSQSQPLDQSINWCQSRLSSTYFQLVLWCINEPNMGVCTLSGLIIGDGHLTSQILNFKLQASSVITFWPTKHWDINTLVQVIPQALKCSSLLFSRNCCPAEGPQLR